MNESPSTLRGDRYAVIRLLGEGGQAATFEAVDKKQGKLVAIKRFRVRGAKSWKEVELAEREARVLASLSHHGLPRYIEHFEENGELFLVTEKIEGESLAALQKQGAPIVQEDVIRFLRETAEILDYLHGRTPPVVHRDIKPSNVLRRPDGSFVLIDFGAVRDKMKPEGGSTVVGTFGFMAPEQFQGRAMPTSDVYAVGATALTMLTGQQPENLPHKGLGIDVAAALGGSANLQLVAALSAMLEPDPDRRAKSLSPLVASLRDTPRKTIKDPPRDEPRRKDAKQQKKKRDIEKDIGQEIQNAVQQVEQNIAEMTEEWEKKAKRHAARAEHRAEHKARRTEREAERRARHAQRHAMAHADAGVIPPPVAAFLIFGLMVAQLAVIVALRAVVPSVLLALSVLFGKQLREAAANVRAAGHRAHASMEQAKRVIRGKTEGALPPLGVDFPDEPVRVRVVENEPTDVAAEEELAAEEEAAEVAKQRRRH